MKVRLEHQLDLATRFEFEMEFVISAEDEASARGAQMEGLVRAFNEGYADAAADA